MIKVAIDVVSVDKKHRVENVVHLTDDIIQLAAIVRDADMPAYVERGKQNIYWPKVLNKNNQLPSKPSNEAD